MRDLFEFMVALVAAFKGRPFVAKPTWWLTYNAKAAAKEVDLNITTACGFFWAAVVVSPAIKLLGIRLAVTMMVTPIVVGVYITCTFLVQLFMGAIITDYSPVLGYIFPSAGVLTIFMFAFIYTLTSDGLSIAICHSKPLDVIAKVGYIFVTVLYAPVILVYKLLKRAFCPIVFFDDEEKDKRA